MFRDVLLKPRTLYTIVVDSLVLDGCVPAHHSNTSTGLFGEETGFNPCLPHASVLFVQDRSSVIKKDSYHLNAVITNNSGHTFEVIIYLRAEWFRFTLPDKFYRIESQNRLVYNEEVRIVDLVRSVSKFSLTHVHPETSNTMLVSAIHHISSSSLFKGHKHAVRFAEISSIRDMNKFVTVECELVSVETVETSGFISFVDSHNTLERVAVKPALTTLPNSFIPGSRFILSDLLVKRSFANKDRHLLEVTHQTHISLISLPGKYPPILAPLQSYYYY